MILAHFVWCILNCTYKKPMAQTSSVTQLAATVAGVALAYCVGSRHKTAKREASLKAASLKQAAKAQFAEDADKHRLTSVVVRVPATTANMGPGFDTIGMALDIWTEISVEILPSTAADAPSILLTNEGEGASELPTDESNLVIIGLKAAYRAAGEELPKKMKIHCKNRIPFARGLGSSSAGIVGGIVAGLALAGMRLPVRGSEQLLQLVQYFYYFSLNTSSLTCLGTS